MVNHGDDKIVYDVSHWEPAEMHAISIQKRYKVKSDYAQMVQKAARTMYDLRSTGNEHWIRVDNVLPPPFKEVLFSDGETVFPGIVNDVIMHKDELKTCMRTMKERYPVPTWWRLLPDSPREIYGIE
jgi:hypothetical protein